MPKKSVAGTHLDPTIKFAKLTIDDQEYQLAYSFNSIAIAEQVAQCNLSEGLQSLTELSALQLRGLLYAALLMGWDKDEPLTINTAGDLIRFDTLVPITTALGESYMLSLPKKSEETADPAESSVTRNSGTTAGPQADKSSA